MRIILLCFLMLNIAIANDVDFPEFDTLSSDEKVEYFWSQHLDQELDAIHFHMNVAHLKDLQIINQLRLEKLLSELGLKGSLSINISNINYSQALKIASEWIHLGELNIQLDDASRALVEKARNYILSLQDFRTKTPSEVYDLVHYSPDLSQYSNKYLTKLFMFCRHDRNYPCLFILKDRFDKLVRNSDGSLWSLPALGKSARNLPYYITNGYTPSGVHSMDSVMPEANRVRAFGKFRRLILNWIPKGKTSLLLPLSAHDKLWWKEASLARNNERKYLRIHGTGKLNNNPRVIYYPHMPTSGCISTREGKYGNVEYKDQRKILDALMRAQNLLPSYRNEAEISGILYVIELDDSQKKVTLETLKEYGIK